MKRKTPLKRTPIKRRPKKDRRTPGEKAYYAWLLTQPCVISGLPCEERHHARSLSMGAGMGLKVKDWYAFPLTMENHRRFHTIGMRVWELRYGAQKDHVKAMWERYGLDKIPEDVRKLVE